MLLHTPTVSAPKLHRLGHLAALTAAILAAGADIVFADARAGAEPNQPVVTRYFDLEANKADSMRAR